MSVTTGDGSTTDDKIPTPWYNRIMATNLMFRALLIADSDLTNPQPDLAESVEVSEDGLVYTIKMKEGLKWSDGEALTAEDVQWSIETALQAATCNSIYTSAFKKIDNMAVDGSTITMTLTEPYAEMCIREREEDVCRYEVAMPKGTTIEQINEPGILAGFGVDAGLACFCDGAVAGEYDTFQSKWHQERPEGNLYDDYFAELFAESYREWPQVQREGGDFITWEVPGTGHSFSMFASRCV